MRAHLQRDSLHQRHPGLTASIASAVAEAASVCLRRHHHPPAAYEIWYDDARSTLVLDWRVPDEQTRAAWGNAIETTEAGAVGLVLTALERSTPLVAVRRAETRTGADYYIGPPGTGREDLEHCLRLEISGVDRGPVSAVYLRVAQKIQQTLRATPTSLPSWALPGSGHASSCSNGWRTNGVGHISR